MENKLPDFIEQYPLSIAHRQELSLPIGADVMDIIMVDDIPGKQKELPNIYLIVRVTQKVKSGWIVKSKTEKRVFITQRVRGLITYAKEDIKIIGNYTITFSPGRSIIFVVFELLRHTKDK